MSRPPGPHGQYEFRLNQVLDFIDTHLADDLSLDKLAVQAHFSRFHFLRLFHDWFGEAPHAYVRRRRLETGASQLRYSLDSIGQIANECGFDSADGFSRAFRQYFGMAPVQWRKQQTVKLSPDDAPATARWPIKVVAFAEKRVAYTRHIGAYGEAAIQQWQQLDQWMQTHGLQGVTRYGMGLDDPSFTPVAKCRYDVCAELPSGFKPPPRTPVKTIAAGLYAVLRYQGPPCNSNRAWLWLLNNAMPSGRYKVAPRPGFERYDASLPTPGAQAQDCDLCLPLELQTAL
ncbi:AraC family transcriptional regulator [Chitinivorax sp. B]|uniref:AraC family transcriptional regulator n=1 Tax=Chitinivorax sp. B TaxID=2502235 RepID=UPI0010F8C09C|nr:AraC family transcriptional regulator [Chitinivorax sp. B]